MFRALTLVPFLIASASGFTEQGTGTLRIKVVLIDAEQKPTGVPRHALLISDNPATAPPRRVLTRADGTVDVVLRPGMYTVESDQPVAFGGKTYQWTAMVELKAGGGASLDLTQENAEVGAVTASPTAAGAPVEDDPSFLLARWQDSVVAVWTTTTRASGFVIDARGLVATSYRAIGDATTAEVQFSPGVKVQAPLVVADAAQDVALFRIDPSVLKSVRPIAVDCAPPPAPLAERQEVFTIGDPFRGQKNLQSATAGRGSKQIFADFRIGFDSSGGPVFTTAGVVAGLTSMSADADSRMDEARIVGAAALCQVLKSAESKIAATAVSSGARLPVEPLQAFAVDALNEAANRRLGESIPYQIASSDFDVSFITPVLVQVAERRWKQAAGSSGAPRTMDAGNEKMRLLTDFGHWSRYFDDFPTVLLVRVTPKLVEGFWTKVARGAAMTQGVALPAMKRPGAGFSRMRVLCGSDEVTPIHPFKLAHRLNEREFAHEGMYVFDPNTLGPQCGSIKLMLYSDKEPTTADTRAVDPKVVQMFWDDFAAYRGAP